MMNIIVINIKDHLQKVAVEYNPSDSGCEVNMRNTHFEQFITNSFRDGVAIRELRLSHEEVEYIKSSYPKASITPCVQHRNGDGRHWYEISLHGLKLNEDQLFESLDGATLHAEKERLLHELEQTKKELERVKQELAMVKSSIK